jgi:aminomethyltransferase
MTAPLRRPPLDQRHAVLGAKFAPFSGWRMPLEYAGGGVIAEHTAVRTAVGVFDVSHLGKATVRGAGAAEFVNATLSNDLDKIKAGQAQYTLCCDDTTGGVVDDLIAYRFADDDVFLVPNAANTAEVVRRLAAAAPAGVTVTNCHDEYAVLAVQGPRSAAVVAALGLPADHAYMSFVAAGDIVVCRTGYTGEHGYELVTPSVGAAALWDSVLAAGEEYGIRPCGLAARDTLRTEMGYPLHGQDLSPTITPVQARLGWAVGWGKPRFWGRDALLAEKAAGPRRTLRGVEATDRGIPRPHMAVYVGDRRVGEVTSGTFSPTRRIGIGLALIDTAGAPGDGVPGDGVPGDGAEVEVDVRGRRSRMTVVRPPFVTPGVA